LNTADKVAAFFIGILGNAAGIDHVNVGHFIKIFFHKAILLQQPANRRGFGEIKLTAQSM
jgi:hypothetical protein